VELATQLAAQPTVLRVLQTALQLPVQPPRHNTASFGRRGARVYFPNQDSKASCSASQLRTRSRGSLAQVLADETGHLQHIHLYTHGINLERTRHASRSLAGRDAQAHKLIIPTTIVLQSTGNTVQRLK